MTRRPEPVRTCVGCRQQAAKSDLVRVVAAGAVLQPDPSGKLPGRGAHLHPSPECLTSAVRRRAFGRALRLPGPLDATAVEEYVAHRSATPTFAERAERRDDSSMSQHR